MIKQISIKNFKSILDQTLVLNPLNVFIGNHGSGKSNLIQVFQLLREIANQNLIAYSLEHSAKTRLHYKKHKRQLLEGY